MVPSTAGFISEIDEPILAPSFHDKSNRREANNATAPLAATPAVLVITSSANVNVSIYAEIPVATEPATASTSNEAIAIALPMAVEVTWAPTISTSSGGSKSVQSNK